MSTAGDTPEVGDIFRQYGSAFLDAFGESTSAAQRHVLDALAACRTSALGGHVDECDECGHPRISYNSCTNRHCPKCLVSGSAEWLDARKVELLPVQYFHVVFTLPAALASLALQNKKVVYDLLFEATSKTLQEIAADPKHLGVQLGFLAILHSWGQILLHHPHIHCVVPGGGLSPDKSRWISCPGDYFLPVKVLSRLFRGKILHLLQRAFDQKRLTFHGSLEMLAEPSLFKGLIDQLYKKEWIVYSKRPFGGPEQVLKYLARYTHRVAISNRRLISIENGKVTFSWKDYADENKQRRMTLDATEFIRRFLLHVLPKGYVRIRHYGFLANRFREASLELCRKLLGVTHPPLESDEAAQEPSGDEDLGRKAEKLCPVCRKGQMVLVRELKPFETYEPGPARSDQGNSS